MAENKCPLCGSEIADDGEFCDHCQNHIVNQYETDLLNKDFSNDGEALWDGNTLDVDSEKEPVVLVDSPGELKNKFKYGWLLALIFFVVAICAGFFVYQEVEHQKELEKEDRFWSQCIEKNTPEVYGEYLLLFEDGRYADEANERIRNLRQAEQEAWDSLRKSGDVNDFYAYLRENPKTPHVQRIRILMDSLTWKQTIRENTAEAYTAYLENVQLGNLSGDYVSLAQDRYAYLSQLKSLEGASLDSLKLRVVDLFGLLSRNNADSVLTVFAPNVAYYTSDSLISNKAVILALEQERKDKKIKELIYTPQVESVIGRIDNEDCVLIDLVLKKETIYDEKVKVGKKTENKKRDNTDTLSIKLNKNKEIESIEIKTKKAT